MPLDPLPEIGDLYNARYRVRSQIGEGGFAVVYAAYDDHAARDVALKILKPDLQDGYSPALTARFEREARAVESLSHRHVVRMFEHGTGSDGRHFATFEILDGLDLDEYARAHDGHRLPSRDVESILRQILTPLREAHVQGLLHRDLKPQNIRVWDTEATLPRVKLMDFGLARWTDDGHPQITTTNELVGTPRYMSPEQLLKQPLTPASDVYSLGVVALELLLGPEALTGNSWGEQLDRLRSGHTFSIPMWESLDPHLRSIIDRMTARDPEDRFADAAVALRALDRTRDQPTLYLPVRRTRPRWQAVAAIAATVAVVAIIFVALQDRKEARVVPVQDTRPPAVTTTKPTPQRPPTPPPEREPKPEPEPVEPLPPLPSTASSGCGADPPIEGEYKGDETYFFIPDNYAPNRAYPLFVVLQQAYEPPELLVEGSGLRDLAARENIIIVAPRTKRLLYAWQPADVEIINARFRKVAANYCIDQAQVYLIAQGQAGALAHFLACEDWVTAIATQAARPGDMDFCPRPLAKPHIMFSGKHDRVYPFAGGPGCASATIEKLSVADMESLWLKHNNCGSERRVTFQTDNGVCHTWDCDQPVESCHLNGGHPWAGVAPRAGKYCDGEPADFPTTERVWTFFQSLHSAAEPDELSP